MSQQTEPGARVGAPPGAGDVLGEHYRLDARIGSGGGADVWRGQDLKLGRTVAVKVFRPGSPVSGHRDAAEAQARAAVSDAAAVAVLDVSTSGPERYVVTELVEGDDLGALIARGPVPPDLARRVAADVAGALTALHARGIAHGGVKPSAILVLRDAADRDGLAAKLNDVGVAPASAAGADGARPAPADDIRALGLVLLASLQGGRAFRRALELADGEVPAPPHTVSADAAALLTAMTDPDPGMRPGAIQVERTLRGDLKQRMTAAEAGTTAPVPLAPGSTPTGGTASVAAAAGLFGVGGGMGAAGVGTGAVAATTEAAGPSTFTAALTGVSGAGAVPTGQFPVGAQTGAVPVRTRRGISPVALLASIAGGAVLVAGTAVTLALTAAAPDRAPARPAVTRSAAAPVSTAPPTEDTPSVVPAAPVAPVSRASHPRASRVTASAAPRPASSTPAAAPAPSDTVAPSPTTEPTAADSPTPSAALPLPVEVGTPSPTPSG